MHPREFPGPPGVDAQDARVRVWGAHEAGFERVFVEIVGESAGAAQEAVVLTPFDALAEPARGHRAAAASLTALRMLA